MTQLYRYRHVNIVRRGNSKPWVKGIEEVFVNGRRQVRYFGNEEWKQAKARERLIGDFSRDFRFLPFDRPFNEPFDRLFLRSFPFDEDAQRDPMHRACKEVVLGEPQLKSARPNPLQDLQQGISHRLSEVQRVIVKLPQALKAAWKELTQ
ncbi:hypothetical protein S7335_2477 [Synechococcus sp. PCC 7335]|uniref:hypothetical protein n=1 Tax=Synechococcus sp. (strain ATCC 29403 / PCC 7335) TaxID=91464 RepID=UPI00017ED925|nr:hypothetical protein [Synechococcus sp. PCC 7335]EDX84780.1 hypothetical protein S7335_2477 [Synechococcus sp. PCC 7335]